MILDRNMSSELKQSVTRLDRLLGLRDICPQEEVQSVFLYLRVGQHGCFSFRLKCRLSCPAQPGEFTSCSGPALETDEVLEPVRASELPRW